MSRYYYGFPPYVSVAKKRATAERKLKELKKKNPNIQPVVIEGRSIASTWWGKSWNQNLERYADYSNRIGRGRSYVRHGAVLDLQIKPGEICALVQGSQARPYKVVISIEALGKSTWKRVRNATEGQLDSLAELLAGKFPKPLQELFFARDEGLFPAPKEIHFDCSCPDWASMCKHVAATLYGIGARLDERPSLFFDLRRIEMDDLITQAVKSTTRTLLKKAETKSSRVMEEADLTDVFDIQLDDDIDFTQRTPKRRGKQTAKAKSAKKAKSKKRVAAKPAKGPGSRKTTKVQAAKGSGSGKKRVAAKSVKGKTVQRKPSGKIATRSKVPGKSTAKSAKKAVVRRKSPARSAKRPAGPARAAAFAGSTFVDIVVSAVSKRRKGVSVADICSRVDLSKSQVRNAVARAVVQGRLETRSRGIYIKPRSISAAAPAT